MAHLFGSFLWFFPLDRLRFPSFPSLCHPMVPSHGSDIRAMAPGRRGPESPGRSWTSPSRRPLGNCDRKMLSYAIITNIYNKYTINLCICIYIVCIWYSKIQLYTDMVQMVCIYIYIIIHICNIYKYCAYM